MKSITISSSGLKNIALNKFTEENNVTLIFGKHEFSMNSIFAEFISPVVSHLHHSDPTIQSIKFDDMFTSKNDDFMKFSDDIISDDIISLLNEISSGYSINIDNIQAFKLRFLSIILGNEELFIKINDLFPPDFSDNNINTYIEYIQCCYHFSQFSPDFDFSGLINNISSNFFSIDIEKFINLPISIQHLIISNPLLRIKSEDSLLDIILLIIEKAESSQKVEDKIESISLLEQVEFTGLSERKLREFLSIFDFNRITKSLWCKFYSCFFIHFDEKPERIAERYSNKLLFEYSENQMNRFNGIIQYLTTKFNGNVDEKGIIKVSSSSILSPNNNNNSPSFSRYGFNNTMHYYPSYAVDLNDKSHSFSSKGLKDSWLKFDFIENRIRPSHYSIRTWNSSIGHSHLMNWVLEGSNTDDENDWKILDSRNNETSLDSSSAENTFKIKENLGSSEYFRYIRIRQTGLNSHRSNQLVINAIEFFGEVI